MFVSEDGHVSGSIDVAKVAELYAGTDDAELKAHYREVLGESDAGKAIDKEAGTVDVKAEDVDFTEPEMVPIVTDDLREQAEALGIKVDGRWGYDRLAEEIAAAKAKDEGEG